MDTNLWAIIGLLLALALCWGSIIWSSARQEWKAHHPGGFRHHINREL